MQQRRAFTLIELLVVIAIIAILAAILFPVFTKAKEAAKVTVSISGMKQVGTAWFLYNSDNDDQFSPRRIAASSAAGNGELSWKQIIFPYVKSIDVFQDKVNPAAKYPDDTSDTGYRASLGQVVVGPRMARGYAYYDMAFLVNSDFNSRNYSPSQVENPADVITIFEHKRAWVDGGPWLNWNLNEIDPILGGRIGNRFGYPWGGKKWEEKAMIVSYVDGHVKRATTGSICGRPDSLNQWNYIKNNLATDALGDITWMDTYCSTRPAAVQ
ncbi:MAG: prepilin-type N-terminal cleavage/methylation domain-containing protein [Chthonomonas sp.]|nr:prepilin-type N-terminal cleavage/methylation domain-containing protein [Chthonomonas sp.]